MDTLLVLEGAHLGTPADRVEVTFAGAAPARALGLGRAAAVIVPSDAVTGPATVTVGGVTSAPFDVVVGDVPAPTVTALVPAAASVGSLVRVEGTDLLVPGDRIAVTFGGVRAVVFGVAPGAITVIVPTARPTATWSWTWAAASRRASRSTSWRAARPRSRRSRRSDVTAGDAIDLAGTDLVDLSAWRVGGLPPFPPFGDLRVTVGGKAAWFVVPTADGLRVRVPFDAVSGDVVVTVNGVASAPVPITVR